MLLLHKPVKSALAAFILLAVSASCAVAADTEKRLSQAGKTAMESTYGVQVQNSGPSKIPGLLEVLTDRGIVYADPSAEFVIVNGAMLETKTKQNLTAQKLDALSAYGFDTFAIADAVKIVRGKGSRKMIAFEDPNCGYCKQLERSLEKVDDVTVYVFLSPVLGADSVAKAKAIWCASDRSKAWKDQMIAGTSPGAGARQDCETPIERNLALFSKLHLRGTPSIYFPSGYHATGAINGDEIEKQLTTTKKGDASRP